MKKFLVSLDFSAVSQDVLEAAIDFARAFQGELTLVHVVPDFEITEGAEALARELIAVCAGQVAQAGLTCSTEVLLGSPVKMIVEEARRIRADYILMGSHGHGKLYSMVVGGTAQGVIKKTSCAVILLPPENKAYD
jgi:nucleotide-binding universal stress UspA family protein